MTARTGATPLPRKVEEDTKITFEKWVESIYDLSDMSQEELAKYYEAFRYHGFDRTLILQKLFEKVKDKKIVTQLIILCAIQGPQRAAKTKLLSGQTPADLGIPASGQKQTENISCARITSSTADIAAFYMKSIGVPKRLVTHPCPAHLQFPAAGSIKMPDDIRQLHIDFSKKFSTLIGGIFNESIYSQMVANSYLDPKLKLFD